MNIEKLNQCYAKSSNGVLTYTIEEHCILTTIISEILNDIFSFNFSKEAFVIVGSHDIGKIHPFFQYKIYSTLNNFDENINQLHLNKNNFKGIEKQIGHHSGISAFRV